MPVPRLPTWVRPTATDLKVAPASEAVVKARDAAILDALRIRPRSTAELLSVLPTEPGASEVSREAARDSALIRLGVKRQIREHDGLWRLAS